MFDVACSLLHNYIPLITNRCCVCHDSILYLSSFFFGILLEAYAFLNTIVDIMSVIPVFFFLLRLCLTSCYDLFEKENYRFPSFLALPFQVKDLITY